MRYARRAKLGGMVLLVLVAAGCGGGSSSSSSTPPSSSVSVTISPSTSTVGYGGSQQFSATVTGATNTAVTWTVSSASSSSSNQIGAISSLGLYQAPAATSVSPASESPQTVSVTAGQAVSGADVAVPALNNSVNSVTVTATSQADTSKSASATVTLSGLSILALGQCVQGRTPLCIAGSTGTEVSQGQTITLFVAGYGILPGTSYSISTGAGTPDVVVTQPVAGQFKPATDGTPTVQFQVSVLPTAALGPRNLVVTNQGNELASFVGAVDITP